MKLLAGSSPALERLVDGAYRPERSVVCRYRNVMEFDGRPDADRAFKRFLTENSLREGARIVPLMTYRGVAVHILDETSGMETGSLKSIDGCLTASLCRGEGIGRIVFESGGNTGAALTRYGRNAGLETFFFCPEDNLDLLDSGLFDAPEAHLVGVADRGRVKEWTGLFANAAGIRQMPDRSWRCVSGMFRGLFILEHMLAAGGFDWISQTVSAAFGPIGIYSVLEAFRGEIRALPGFLGVQQEENCPMYRAWNPSAAKRRATGGPERGRLLSRIMYDDSPFSHRTYEALRRLLLMTRGDLLTVSGEEFDSYLYPSSECGAVLERLRSLGIAIRHRSGQVLDKTGMIALAGTLKAIDSGIIRAGGSVLCALTGGAGEADGLAQPERTVRSARDVLDFAAAVREGKGG